MINTLYVAGSKSSFPGLKGQNINLDYVQNGMIALSAIQSGDFDCIIVEDELPLMAPSRLIQELFKTNSAIPIIALVRSNKRRSNLLSDVGMGLFGYYEPEISKLDRLVELLKKETKYRNFKSIK